MKEFRKSIDSIFILFILELFILMSLFFLNSKVLAYDSYVLFCLFFFLIVISFYTKLKIGLGFSLLIDLIYGGYIFFVIKSFHVVEHGLWLIAFPIIATSSGLLGMNVQGLNSFHKKVKHKYYGRKKDKLTGLNEKQIFYEDLLTEAKSAKRHNLDIAVMMAKLEHYDELLSLYGKNKVDSVMLMATNILEKTVRAEDSKYRWAKDTLAVILPYSDVKSVEVIKQRLTAGLAKISILAGKERIAVKFKVVVDVIDYTQEDIT